MRGTIRSLRRRWWIANAGGWLLAFATTAPAGCKAADDSLSDAPSGAAASEPTTGGSSDDAPAPGTCGEETVTIIADPGEIPAGYRTPVAQQLDEIEGNYTGVFDWRANEGSLSVAHAGTSSAISMEVAYTGGEIRLTAVELAGDFPSGQDDGTLCVNTLDVEMSVGFSTEDGLFAERWTVPVQTYSEGGFGFPQQGTFVLDQTIDFATHQGALLASDFQPAGGATTSVAVVMEFPPRGPTLGRVRHQTDSTNDVSEGNVAFFSADPESR